MEWVRDNDNNFTCCAVYFISKRLEARSQSGTIALQGYFELCVRWEKKRFDFKWDFHSDLRCCQKGTKTDKTSEFTLLNVDSEVYPQSSMPESVNIKFNAILLENFDQSQNCRSIKICKICKILPEAFWSIGVRYKCFCGS